MRNSDGSVPAPDVQLEHASEMLVACLRFIKDGYRFSHETRRHCQKWAQDAAHAVFKLHPDLREDGSLARYFVGKAGRKLGLRGAKLTLFIEKQYAEGTWYKLVPESVLQGKAPV